MAGKIKYAGEEAVSRIADYVNQKLKFVSTMPISPIDGEAVLFIGATDENYEQGGVYEYDETNDEWILRNLVQVVELTKEEYDNLTPEEQNNGVIYLVTDENFLDATEVTKAEYEALTPEEKYNGTIYFITDEDLPGSIVEGYYNPADDKFYEESTYTTEIAGIAHIIYISLDTNIPYRYDVDTEKFEMICGEEDPEIIHVPDLPGLLNVENKIYMTGYASKIIDVDPASEEKILSMFPNGTLYETSTNQWEIESDIFKIYISPYNSGDRYLVSMNHNDVAWTFTDYANNTYNIAMSGDARFIIGDTRRYFLGDNLNHKIEEFFTHPYIPQEVVEGYLNETDGKFYEDSFYTIEIEGRTETIYVTIDTNLLYRFNTVDDTFIQIGMDEIPQEVVEGYLNETNGKFYKENTYTTEILGNANSIYMDLSSNLLYRYDTTNMEFVKVGGSDVPDAIVHVDTLPSSGNIENKIYEYGYAGENYPMTNTGESAISSIPCFEESLTASIYIVKTGYVVKANNKEIDNVVYDDTTSTFTVNFKDSTHFNVASGDIITFTVINNREYYLGDETNQLYVKINDYTAGSGINISPEHVISVVNRLEEINALPIASVDYLDKFYLLTATQTGYTKGAIYICREIPDSSPTTYEWKNINEINLGSAAFKGATDLVRPNSHDLVESGSVYSAIANAVSTVFVPHGNITCAELVPTLLVPANVGNLYNVTDSGVTTSDFMGGAGQTINPGDTVGIINAGPNIYLFNLMPGLSDLSKYENVYYGYLNETDGKFYKESTYITEITAKVDALYVAVDTWKTYAYDLANTEYILVGGTEPDAIIYVSALPSTNIKNVIYALNSEIDHVDTIATNFLDDNDLFEKEIIDENNYKYVPASGVEIKASIDDTVYKPFSYLQYNDTFMNWTIVFTDGTNDTLNTGDDFYYKEIKDMFYAGNAEEQVLTPLAAGGSGGGGAEYAPGEGISISNSVISVLPATAANIGGVKPDQTTITINQDGVIRGNYQAGHGVKITNNTISDRTFIGTQAEWDALTPAQQAEYDMISISDDGAPVDLTSGHIIVNGSGTSFTQRNNLQFEDVTVTDDSVNSSTVITPIPYTAGSKIDITNKEISVDSTVKGTFIGTQAEWNALSVTDKAKYDIVNLTDDNVTPTTVVDTVAEDNFNPVTSNAVYDKICAKTNVTSQITVESGVDATIRNIAAFTQNDCLYIYGRVQFTNALAYDSAFLDLGTFSVGDTIYIMTDGVYARANKIRVIDNVTSGTNLCFSCVLPLN